MKYKIASVLSIIILSLALLSHVAFAIEAESGGTTPGGAESEGTTPAPAKIVPLQNPLNEINSVNDLLYKFVDLAIFLGVIFAVFMFFWIGFKFVMARGNSSELEEARKWFFYAVIGTAILISSKVIVEVLKNTFENAGVIKEGQFDQKFK